LLSLGYKILEQNLKIKNNEIDLIAFDKKFDEIVFIEVKTRKDNFFGNPAEAVTRKKLKNIIFVAKRYLKLNNFNKDYRFDIIAISKNDIEHFENVSWNA